MAALSDMRGASREGEPRGVAGEGLCHCWDGSSGLWKQVNSHAQGREGTCGSSEAGEPLGPTRSFIFSCLFLSFMGNIPWRGVEARYS